MPRTCVSRDRYYRRATLFITCDSALLNAVDAEGKSIFAGKEFTGFSNVEEVQVDAVKAVPFSLEDELQKKGGKYSKAEPWQVSVLCCRSSSAISPSNQPKVVVDGHLYTGQNPASAGPLGKTILEAFQK